MQFRICPMLPTVPEPCVNPCDKVIRKKWAFRLHLGISKHLEFIKLDFPDTMENIRTICSPRQYNITTMKTHKLLPRKEPPGLSVGEEKASCCPPSPSTVTYPHPGIRMHPGNRSTRCFLYSSTHL